MTTTAAVADRRRGREARLRQAVALGGELAVERVVPLRWAPAAGLGAGAVAVEDALPAAAAFATLQLVREAALGGPVRRYGVAGEEVVERLLQAEYQVQFYRPGAAAAAERFLAWLWSEAAIQHCAAAAYRLDAAGYRRLDALVADAWEERALVDLACRWWQTHRVAIGEIAAFPSVRIAPDFAASETFHLTSEE